MEKAIEIRIRNDYRGHETYQHDPRSHRRYVDTHRPTNRVQFLPNTSGVRNAEEAVLAAQFSRECFGTDFVKLEIHPDPKYLLPDPVETLKATEQLAKLGFVVLPYIQADPYFVNEAEEVGAARRNALRRTDRHPNKDCTATSCKLSLNKVMYQSSSMLG